ncbi:MAG: bifunctional UDP-N-acetylglucosamine diphosphorylase/glucosamine-1-phosphate N-acetyltransferase GlmU [Deltaproteobacteria bacterium]|nr:bifunctional UDP-N-acetylglucosamine diphosphorylase/glucosamine-1-phosphate N-acetyltransferase GlmU [Deltaproteobacteria bacterium]
MRRDAIGAVVLAAGRSTRFRSARSKLVHPLAGRAVIDWVLGGLRRLDVAPIVAVVGGQSDELRATCGTGITFAVQAEPRGTGHAVLAAEAALGDFDGSLLLLYGDLPLLRAETLQRLCDAHRAAGGGLSLLTATVDDPFGWGRIVRRDGRVIGIVEQRDATPAEQAIREVNVGVYCVQRALLFELLHEVRPDNAQGEIYLTDIVAGAVARGVTIAAESVDVAEVGQINSRGELAAMEQVVRARINADWMAAGVTLEDPVTTYIGPEVTIGADTVLGPNTHLRGRTAIGARCRVDGSAYVTDSALADDVHLKFGVVLTDARVGAHCQIGPFAHLRPGTQLAEHVHIGDFVETKNARLGRGSKANHLAYLGDAELGRDVNIGAGTITCNYDGFSKQKTIIGDRVQVGSDSTLVAPVRIGDDAYLATATTVRSDVAAGALVFNRRDQVERPGWVAAFRARQAGAATAARAAGKPKSANAKPAKPQPTRTRAAKGKTAAARARQRKAKPAARTPTRPRRAR